MTSADTSQRTSIVYQGSQAEVQDPTALFTAVLQDFDTSLPESARRSFCQYGSSADMLAAVKAGCQQHKQSSRLSACASKIAAFSDTFAPFFDVINIFVQVKPEWLGIFWGSVRLIFQLGKNHIELMEKIADQLEILSWTLPQYERHLQRARKMQHTFVPDRLVRLMSSMAKDARARDRLAFLIGSFSKPFDARFSELMEKMKTHQYLFESELYVEDQEELMYRFQEFEKDMRKNDQRSVSDKVKEKLKNEQEDNRIAAAKILQIREWLGSNDYQRPFERARRMRFGDTGDWLFKQEAFMQWRDAAFEGSQTSSPETKFRSWLDGILSLQAKPGYGKTVLSAAVIGHLDLQNRFPQSAQSVQQPCTAFFYFERGDPMRVSPGDVMKALASQLIYFHRNDRGMLDGLTLLTETRISGQPQASHEDAEIVLRFLLDRFPCYIVLDAIDECAEQLPLLSSISLMCENVDAKILMLSRPDINLPWQYRSAKDNFRVIKLSESYNLPDIERFLEDEIGKAVELGLFGSPEDRYHQTKSEPEISNRRRAEQDKHTADSSYVPYESILEPFEAPLSGFAERRFADCATDIEILTHRRSSPNMVDLKSICARIATQSKGMFLWARLLTNYLSNPALSPNERLEAVSGVHYLEDIDKLYLSILEKVVQKFQKEKKMALKIFKWLIFALCPLSIDSLHAAVTLLPGRPTAYEDKIVDFAASIDRITCALVELDERGVPRLIHTSFADFLRAPNPDLEKSGFSLRDTEAVQCHLAISCLSYIVHDMPRAPLHNLNLASRYDLEVPCGEDERLPSRHQGNSSAQSLATRRRRLRNQYPLLQYASLCWPDHLTKSGISNFNRFSSLWKDILSEFLLDRTTVTVWVEACWTFRLSPSISRLIEASQQLANTPYPIPADRRELIWTLRGLNTLSHALKSLKTQPVGLGEEPTRIWLPQIRAATDPEYWPNWNFEVQYRPELPQLSSLAGGAGFLPDREPMTGPSLQPAMPYVV